MVEAVGVLGEIVARKREDIAARFADTSIETLRAGVGRTERRLRAALAKAGARFIMEVKRVSPSEGTLKQAADPAEVARGYRGAADAISVLTDTPYFGGSFEDLAAVRAAFDGPILCKDFMIDLRQVAEARRYGADAILVMLSVLGDDAAAAMIAEAGRFGMDVLVEAHDETEVRRAVALGAPIIGINNRDLRTLHIDLAVTERLASLVPADRLLVSESGIKTRDDVRRLAPIADAFLVGSALMKAPDPREAARALTFGRVKICGMTRKEDVDAAAEAGATHAGLIMVPDTPRYLSAERAAQLARHAAAIGLKPVGVFRDAPSVDIVAAVQAMPLAAVQLHGREDATYVSELRTALPASVELWLATPVDGDRIERREGGDRSLFDTKVAGQSGGTGTAFDWHLLQGRDDLASAIVAGGIGPDNARAAAAIAAYALDVSSGVEDIPGIKSRDKLSTLFDNLRIKVRGDDA